MEVGEVVLPAIGVAVAKQAHTELVVLEQKAAKIGVERLDADADRVEVVKLRHVSDMVVDKPFLETEEIIGAGLALRRVDVKYPDLAGRRVVEIERRGDADFEIWRFERGIALNQRQFQDIRFTNQCTAIASERAVLRRPRGVLRPDPGRHPRRFVNRVGNRPDIDEPIIAEDRLVGFQRVGVVRIERVFAAPQRVEDAPTILHRHLAPLLEGLRRRQRLGVDDRLDAGRRRFAPRGPTIIRPRIFGADRPFNTGAVGHPVIRLGAGM